MERFKLNEDGNVMGILVSVDDPVAYTTLWSAIQRFGADRRALMLPPIGSCASLTICYNSETTKQSSETGGDHDCAAA
jgi:hypothetical protein